VPENQVLFALNSLKTGLRLLALAVAVSACAADGKTPDEPAATAVPTLPVTTLAAADQRLFHEYVANIEAERNVEVRAKVRGYLDQIFVDEGKLVKKGQPLFRIQPSEYRNQLDRAQASESGAEADVTAAKLQLERVKLLVDKNIIAKSELGLAQARLHAAQAAANGARASQRTAGLNLGYTLVRAPFDGIINRIPLKVGSLIENGMLLTTVSDLSEVFAYFNVSEAEYLEYVKTRERHPERANSDTVTLLLADGSRYAHPGYVETVEGEIDENTGSIAFRARFDNPKRLLKHGASGRVRLANVRPDAVLVPQQSVFEIQDKSYVYLLDKQNRVRMHAFEPQQRTGLSYLVKSGLQAGDRIVYEGTQGLKDGQVIRPRDLSPDTLN